MPNVRKFRPYHLAIIAIVGAATISSVPLMETTAHADAASCAAATATAQADQQQLNDLLAQLRQAKQTLAEDQAALDEVTKDVTDDNNVIDQHNQLVQAGQDDGAKFQETLGAASSGLLGFFASAYLDKGFS
jgi:peptidoglycan hydrolase CwlO-like protein